MSHLTITQLNNIREKLIDMADDLEDMCWNTDGISNEISKQINIIDLEIEERNTSK